MKQVLKGFLQAALRRFWPAQRSLDPAPLSRAFGLDRGQAIDRYYISSFINANRAHISGVALEIAEPRYATLYRHQLKKIEILHVLQDAKGATIIGDLSQPATLPHEIADCFICTQTFQFIYDVSAAITGAAQLLKPGGTLLATFSGISQISRYDMDRWGDYWRFTTASVSRLLEDEFAEGSVDITSYGNVAAASAFLYGYSVQDIERKETLEFHDPDYPVIIAVRATKPAASSQPK